MPRLVRALPKYRKHRASGQAVVTLGGKDHYLGPHGTKASHLLYDRLIAEWLAGGRTLPADDPDAPLMVVELLNRYWQVAKAYYVKNGEPTGELDQIKIVIRDTKRLYGRTPVAEFGPKALKAVRQTWIDAGKSRGTINRATRRLCRIFRWAVAEELIAPSIADSLRAVAGLKRGRTSAKESEGVAPVPEETVAATLPLMSPTVADMVRLQLLTGCRPGEVCVLRPRDIDRAGDVWEFTVEGHKTEHHERHRTVFIGPAGQAILRPYLLRDANAYCFCPADAVAKQRESRHENRVTPMSCGNRPGTNRKKNPRRKAGKRYTTDSYRRAIHRACDAAFPPPEELDEAAVQQWRKKHRWSPNRLRHTKGTEIRKRFGLEAAQVILGHAAADVTQVYAERDAEKAREVARMIG